VGDSELNYLVSGTPTRGARSIFLRPTKSGRGGGSEGQISKRLLRPTISLGTKYFGVIGSPRQG